MNDFAIRQDYCSGMRVMGPVFFEYMSPDMKYKASNALARSSYFQTLLSLAEERLGLRTF